jgi:hypothetical protein
VLSPCYAMGCNPVSMVDPLGLQAGMHPFTKPLGMQDPAAFARSIAPTLAEHAPGGSKWGLSNMARYISTLPSEAKGEAWLQYLTGGAGGSLFKENLTEHYRKEDIRNDKRRTAERIMELYETLVYGGAKGRGWVPEEQRFYHDEVIAQTSRPSNYWREWLGQQSSGGGDNGLGLGLSFASFGTGVYADYLHNHKTYTTTGGQTRSIYKANGAYRSARAAQFGQMSKFVKGLGVAGAVVSTGYSGYKVVNQYQAGGVGNINPLDATDVGVGVIGIGSTILTGVGLISNPIGWGIGIGVTLYFGGRLVYDLIND